LNGLKKKSKTIRLNNETIKRKKYKRIAIWLLLILLAFFSWGFTAAMSSVNLFGFFRSDVLRISDLNKSIATCQHYLILTFGLFLILVLVNVFYKNNSNKNQLNDKMIKGAFIVFLFLMAVNIYFLLKRPWQINKIVMMGFHEYDYMIRRNMIFIYTPLLGLNILMACILAFRKKYELGLERKKIKMLMMAIIGLSVLYATMIYTLPVFMDKTELLEWMKG